MSQFRRHPGLDGAMKDTHGVDCEVETEVIPGGAVSAGGYKNRFYAKNRCYELKDFLVDGLTDHATLTEYTKGFKKVLYEETFDEYYQAENAMVQKMKGQ